MRAMACDIFFVIVSACARCTAPRCGRDVVPQLARGVMAVAPEDASS